MKYRIEVGSHVTHYVKRTITVYANNEADAGIKAMDKFFEKEGKLNSIDSGSPQVNSIELAD